jgi:hypothetical protein
VRARIDAHKAEWISRALDRAFERGQGAELGVPPPAFEVPKIFQGDDRYRLLARLRAAFEDGQLFRRHARDPLPFSLGERWSYTAIPTARELGELAGLAGLGMSVRGAER